MSFAPFVDHRDAAMAVITSGAQLSRKEGQFCGGCAFDLQPLTEKQVRWLSILIDRYNVVAIATRSVSHADGRVH